MVMKRYLLALVCACTFMAGCGVSHDGELLWKFKTKKTNRLYAALDAQRLFLCSDDMYCLEKATGRLFWEFKTFGSHLSAPVIEGEYLFFQCGGLYALDSATGDVLWEFWTTGWASLSPVVSDGRVYASIGRRLYCLDAASGQRLWSVKTGTLEKKPVVIGDSLFFSVDNKIVCLDVSSRKVVWDFDVGSGSLKLASGGSYLLSVNPAGLVRAHQVENGQVQWQFETGALLVSFCRAPNGQVLVSAGVLYCLDPESGLPLWTFAPDHFFVTNSNVFGQYILVKGGQKQLFYISILNGEVVSRLRVPRGGLLVTAGSDAAFSAGNRSREVFGLSVPVL